jgi:hypothetical protein
MNLEKLNANYGQVLTPADTDQANQYYALYIGGTGNVRVTTIGGDDVLFTAVPVGTILPVKIKRLWLTNTTATLIVGLR